MSKYINYRLLIGFACFSFFIWGGYFIDKRFENISIFVFNCPYNLTTPVQGTCLFLTELVGGESLVSIRNTILMLSSAFLSIILLGKILCGYICPFGFFQEILFKIRGLLGINKLRFNETTRSIIRISRWVILLVFMVGVGFCTFCPVRYTLPTLAGFRTEIEIAFIIGIIIIGISFLSERFFCRICPMGLIIGLFNKVTPWKLRKDCTACTSCGICYEACPMDIKEIYTERESEDVFMTDCILCGKCIDSCPEDNALHMDLVKIGVQKSSREKYYKKN